MAELEFEKKILELERQIAEFEKLSVEKAIDLSAEIESLRQKLSKVRKEIFDNLTAAQRTQVARLPGRPTAKDYIVRLFPDFIELHGDRLFRDDPALMGGCAKLGGRAIVLLAQEKGKGTKERLDRNFGMMNPEGYRKAVRLMRLAEKFSLPVVSLIDTPGAYPGVGAEERGQGWAIAESIAVMCSLQVPILCAVIGEGASGGALGIGVGDVVLMLEHAIYPVISPEGCAAILWRDAAMAPQAAEALRMTASDLLNLGIIDEIVPEPLGGAHQDPDLTARTLGKVLAKHLKALSRKAPEELVSARRARYRVMGRFEELEQVAPLELVPPAPASAEAGGGS